MACSGPLWLPGDCAPYGTSPPGGCRAEVHLAHPLGGQGLELPQVPRIAHFLITPGPPTDRRAVPVQDELAPLLMSVRFPVCLEDGLHLLSPENVGFFESVTKPSGFVVETLPWFLEGYSGHSVEMQADYSGDSCFECSDGAPVIGVHDPPGLEVRDYLLDHPADLIDLRVEFLLPVQQLAARGLLEGRDHPVPDEALVAGPVKRVSVQENL